MYYPVRGNDFVSLRIDLPCERGTHQIETNLK